jgi:hypothetical protein
MNPPFCGALIGAAFDLLVRPSFVWNAQISKRPAKGNRLPASALSD